MKNEKEVCEALLDGETIIYLDGDKAKLNEDGILIDPVTGNKREWFLIPRHLEIYKKPEWYENIPEGGVLCWCWDDSRSEKMLDIVYKHSKFGFYNFSADACNWENATPLTKQEIQVFVDNVPEGE